MSEASRVYKKAKYKVTEQHVGQHQTSPDAGAPAGSWFATASLKHGTEKTSGSRLSVTGQQVGEGRLSPRCHCPSSQCGTWDAAGVRVRFAYERNYVKGNHTSALFILDTLLLSLPRVSKPYKYLLPVTLIQ